MKRSITKRKLYGTVKPLWRVSNVTEDTTQEHNLLNTPPHRKRGCKAPLTPSLKNFSMQLNYTYTDTLKARLLRHLTPHTRTLACILFAGAERPLY